MPPYVGEIRMFAGNFAPNGWMFCEGQPLPINEFETLFQLIGTTYGGDGEFTFNLPNLASRIPTHQGISSQGINYNIGELAGVEEETLTLNQIPSHNHPVGANNSTSSSSSPANGFLGRNTSVDAYTSDPTDIMVANLQTIGPAGGSQPHSNLMPYICINFVIALFGIFPSQT